jgi:hypothetical protein
MRSRQRSLGSCTYLFLVALALLLSPAVGYCYIPSCQSYGISESWQNTVVYMTPPISVQYTVQVNWACNAGDVNNCIVCETDTLCQLINGSYQPLRSLSTQDTGSCATTGNSTLWRGTFTNLDANDYYEVVCSYKGYIPAVSECDNPNNYLIGARIYFNTY